MSEKNIKELEKVKFDFGNWQRPDYYSRRARKNKEVADGDFDHGREFVGCGRKPGTGQPSLASCYPRKPADAVRAMTLTLAKDVFCLPLAVQTRITQDEALLAPFDADLFHVMREIGDCGVLHVNRSNSENELLKNALKIGRHLYLTEEPAGMTVRAYIFYLLEYRRRKEKYAKTTSEWPDIPTQKQGYDETIREWSGIPVQRQGYVYEKLIELFRACLQLYIHEDQLKYAYAGPFDMPRHEVVASKERQRRDAGQTVYGAVKKVAEKAAEEQTFDQVEFQPDGTDSADA